MNTERSRRDILDEVEELAVEVLKFDPDLTIEAARATVYEEVPELYEEYVASTPETPHEVIAKSEREPTLAEEIHQAVRKRAGHLAWTQWPHKTIEDIELEVWSTPDGEKLYSLYTSPEARLPMSSVEHKLYKRHSEGDAWSVLKGWLAE